MEDINFLLGGMDLDSNPQMAKENHTGRVLNFTCISKEGNIYSISNEDGNVLIDKITFPSGFKVIGYSILNNEIIVILVNGTFSQIGIISENDFDLHPDYGYYHPVAPVDELGNVPVNNSEFGFSLEHPVVCESRKLIDGSKILYYTDNFNPFGRVDLTNPPKVGKVRDTSNLIYNQKFTDIQVIETIESGFGKLYAGVYQFVTRYITNSGDATVFGLPSEVYPVIPTFKKNGVNKVAGEYNNQEEPISKSLKLQINNIDTNFQFLELAVCYYEGTESTFRSFIVSQIPITKDSEEFIFSQIPDNAVEVTREEIRQLPVSYNRAKAMVQKDNTLFLSNLSSPKFNPEIYQKIANKIKVKYKVQEVPYCGRGLTTVNGSSSFFSLVSAPRAAGFSLYLTLTQDVDSSTNSSIFSLTKNGTVASSNMTVDYANLVNGDTFTTPAFNTQSSIVFTGVTGTPTTNQFKIETDTITTITNIISMLSDSPDITDFSAINSGNNIIFSWNYVDVGVNGLIINDSSSGLSSTPFTGASTVLTTEAPTDVIVVENNVELRFTTLLVDDYTLDINNLQNFDFTETYTETGILIDFVGSVFNNSSFEGFSDYINEQFNYFKSYRRGEVYSFGFCLLFKNGSSSEVFHIPGDKSNIIDINFPTDRKFEKSTWTLENSGNTGDYLGTYVSDLDYPLNAYYPGDQEGDDLTEAGTTNTLRKIRHHLIPDIKNEPHYRLDNDGNVIIRTLHVEFEFTESFTITDLRDVEEIIFTRERRSTSENKSVLFQGIVNKQIINTESFNIGSGQSNGPSGIALPVDPVEGTSFTTDQVLVDAPFFNNFSGFVFESTALTTGKSPILTNVTFPVDHRYNFYSPEILLDNGSKVDDSVLNSSFLDSQIELIGDFKVVGDYPSTWEFKNKFAPVGAYWRITNREFNSGDCSGLYKDYTFNNKVVEIETGRLNQANQNRIAPLKNSSLFTSTRWTGRSLEIITSDDLSEDPTSFYVLTSQLYDFGNYKSYPPFTPVSPGKTFKFHSFDLLPSKEIEGGLKRKLYNLKFKNNIQYGVIDNKEHIMIGRKTPFIKDSEGNIVSIIDNYTLYGGDTYITQFAFSCGTLLTYVPHLKDDEYITGVWSAHKPKYSAERTLNPRGYNNLDGLEKMGAGQNKPIGSDYRWLTSYFVESEYNTFFRHKSKEESLQNYFPNDLDARGILNAFLPWKGEIDNYNYQYSYENNIKTFYTKSIGNKVLTGFENRTIYSLTASNDDILDTYRIFLQDKYHDIPSNTGPIWNSFIFNNDLYLHTPKALWKTFAEPAATLVGDNISDVVLGTGGLFQRPSQLVYTDKGGYGGTISQFGGVFGQMGYIFPDILQGKVFILTSNSLEEISNKGLTDFFKKNMLTEIISNNGNVNYGLISTDNAYLIDNPFKDINFLGSYDYSNKRYIITKRNDFTISFSALTGSWISFHSYNPSVLIPFDNRLLMVNQDTFWEGNKGNKGSYFGSVYPSEIEIISALAKIENKTYENIIILSQSFNNTNVVRDDNFKFLKVYTNKGNTGIIELVHNNEDLLEREVGKQFIKFKNNEYRIAIPRDAVIDQNLDIQDVNNLDLENAERRIKGTFANLFFSYDNNLNLNFILHKISTIFNKNIR